MSDTQSFWGGTKLKVSKLEAAVRQLDMAITLWFNDEDIIAVHTLAAAAHQVIHDINNKRGGRDLIYDSLLIKDEYRKEWVRLIKAPMNFFKHADTDPDPSSIIEVHSATSMLYFFFSILGLKQLGVDTHTSAQVAFMRWIEVHHPSWVKPEHRLENRIPVERLNALRDVAKRDFLQAFTSLWQEVG